MLIQDRVQRTMAHRVRTPGSKPHRCDKCPLNLDKGACEDIDECMDVDFICDPNAMCVNDIMDVAKVNYFRVLGSDSLTNQINVFSSISLERWKLTLAFAVQEPLSSFIWSTRTIRTGCCFPRTALVLSSETH